MNFCYHPNEKSFSQEMFCSLIVIIVPFWRGWDESLLEKLFNSITVPHNILFLSLYFDLFCTKIYFNISLFQLLFSWTKKGQIIWKVSSIWCILPYGWMVNICILTT